ncbi:MAG: hypothetical protein QGG14_04395, partial [Planctomycetota bacterium]|nr:hypothetical protein [Planctomycetota bacterium]
MRLGLSQVLRPEQRLVQSPQMIQAMQVLQYPLLELKDRIDQELEDNVLLDRVEPEVPNERDRRAEEPTPEEQSSATFEQLEEIERRSRDWDPGPRRVVSGDNDAKFEALANSPGPSETLSEHLVLQVALLELDEDLRERVELVIFSLDRDGRLVTDFEELLEEASCTEEEIKEATELVQSLEPTGVGARDLSECLRLQLAGLGGAPELATRVVTDHLENLSMNRLPRIAR